MGLVDVLRQVKSVMAWKNGGTGNRYGYGTGVVERRLNRDGAAMPLGTVVKRSGSGRIETDDTEDSIEVIGVVIGYFRQDLADGSIFVPGECPEDGMCAVMTKGRCQVLVGPADVDSGDYLFVSSTDGAVKGSPTVAAGAFGLADAAGDDTELMWAWLFGSPVLAAGGSTSPLTTKGDVYGFDTADARIPVGTNGQLLTADSSDAQGVVWATKTTKWQVTATFHSVAANDQIWIRVPYDCTVTGWDITANASGSAVVDVWQDTYANFPPTVLDTIAGSEKPTLSAARKNQDTSLSTWTTALVEGRYLMFNVDSSSGIATLQVALYGTRNV